MENPGGWLTTVVARVCPNLLRAREARREDELAADRIPAASARAVDPEEEALLADSVGNPFCTTCSRCRSTRSPR
ncbi:hypothetical protein SCANM124S_04736 [Streptomyces canus]